MFGKRSSSTAIPSPPPVAPPPAVRSATPSPARAEPKAQAPQSSLAPSAPKPARTPVERARSEEYFDVKTTVFNALIDTIDLTQLSKLDPEAAREEICDIVSEIVAIKNVVMSISEQEELLEDICNDVLGYGPLEPLLARDDIADIMVNGCDATYIEVNGKVEPSAIHFADNAQLMNICQRIVSQVGRRVDEFEPDLRCATPRREPRQRHRAASRHRRPDADHPQIQTRPADFWISLSNSARSRPRDARCSPSSAGFAATSSSPAAPARAKPRCLIA